MEKSNNPLVLYKNLGETPLACIERFKIDHPEYKDVPMTYAGRLDPMAEGVLLVLSGDLVHEKEKYLGLSKTYVFEILWGFETDTLDLLGRVVESYKVHKVESGEIERILKNSKGTFVQKYPVFSSKPVQGKPLFQWAREGKLSEIEIPTHQVEIFDTKFISCREVSKEDLLADILSKIEKVSGDFRQKEIQASWQEAMSKSLFDMFVVDTVEIRVSSGFYVRQFVADLAEKLGVKAVTFYIKRIQVGEFSVQGILE